MIFFLGFFLDTFEIIFVVVPIAAPALIKLGVDPIWLGVMIGVNLQTSFLTPPFGFALFYLRGVAGRMLSTLDIYRGAIPFVVLQIAGLGARLDRAEPRDVPAGPAVRHEAPMPDADDRGPAAPVTSSGSPVADDFSDLFEEPTPGTQSTVPRQFRRPRPAAIRGRYPIGK